MTVVLRANSCSACGHSLRVGADLQCRRFPPTTTPILVQGPKGPTPAGYITAWAIVQPDNWCGEFNKVLRSTEQPSAA